LEDKCEDAGNQPKQEISKMLYYKSEWYACCSLRLNILYKERLVLHFDSKNIQAVKKALLLSTTSSGSLYGKTGTGRVNGKDVNGWFIGYIETANNTYYFATNIQSSSGATGSQATEITESVLSNLGIWK
jgi:beta-lactamase class D